MVIDVAGYLSEQQRKSTAENAKHWSTIEELYNKKLWYQLTLKIKEFVKQLPGSDLVNFYKNFIADFQQKINSLELAHICTVIAKAIKDDTDGLAFWETISEQVKKCELSQALCLTEKGLIHLKQKRIDKTKELMTSAEEIIDKLDGVSPVHCQFYKLSSAYYTAIASYSMYYKHALLYLGCMKMEDIPVNDQIETAFYISLAAILGEKTYNFGELLVHPILDTLRNGEKQWLVDLLFAFNSGDINMYKSLKPKWTMQADLLKNELKLERKMRLLCLMEMAFKRSSTDRHISFADIASATDLPETQVEMLVIRALSLGLVKGKLDEVNRCAVLTWVQPRVLTRHQVAGMQKRLTAWCRDVNRVEQLVMRQAEEILT